LDGFDKARFCVIIKHLSVMNFRGIRNLDWRLPGPMVCLIGPGDSTKSTILDAIECALSPRWDVPFADTDFYMSKTDQPIEITVTVGQLPQKLMDDKKFGLQLRGWSEQDGLHDEPQENDDPVISLRLQVDSSLEPVWTVVNDRNPAGIRITNQDRESLGMVRLGSYVDRHLSWGRGSALARLTGPLEEVSAILAEAGRSARQSIEQAKLPKLTEASAKATEAAKSIGVKPKQGYRPALDAQSSVGTTSALSLHDGDVPMRMAGLGSRRLLTLALQRSGISDGALILLDEAEHGLEPHRLRHLVRKLRPSDEEQGKEPRGQAIVTTHSPITIVELKANELCVVRSKDGTTTVQNVSADLQATIRATPEALLGQKVIVCEGKTEFGLSRALDQAWESEAAGMSLAYWGVVPVDGGGSNAPKNAMELRGLGYETVLLGDSDVPINPNEGELNAVGIQAILWADNKAIEERLSTDLPLSALQEVLDRAVELHGRQSVFDTLAAELGLKDVAKDGIEAWLNAGLSEEKVRTGIGSTAKGSKWFKRVDYGEQLGQIVAKYLSQLAETDTGKKITDLKTWVYADA
jgi:hypothetical protein